MRIHIRVRMCVSSVREKSSARSSTEGSPYASQKAAMRPRAVPARLTSTTLEMNRRSSSPFASRTPSHGCGSQKSNQVQSAKTLCAEPSLWTAAIESATSWRARIRLAASAIIGRGSLLAAIAS